MPIQRPRYRRHRRHSPRFAASLAALVARYSGHEATIAVSTVGSDVLALAGAPDAVGPFTLRGVLPPELSGLARFWVTFDESNHATIYESRADLAAGRSPVALASWGLSTTWATLGTPIAISAVTNAADTLTSVAHGLAVGAGPFYVTASVSFPTGLAATTPYWIKTVPTPDTFTLTASLGGALINLTGDGSGTITLVPVNVDLSLDTLAIAAHGMITGGGPVRLTTAGALPTGLATGTDYYVIRISAGRFALASSRANALAGTAVNLTAIGSGTGTVARALTLGKDLSADGLIEWMNQGISLERMQAGVVGDVDTLFV